VTLCGFEGQERPQEWFYASRDKKKWAKENGAKGVLEIYTSTQIPFSFLTRFFTGTATVLDEEDEDAFPYLWLNASDKEAIATLKNTKDIACDVSVEGSLAEKINTYNVVGMIEGTDPELKDEYIIYSAHYDHIGVGRPIGQSCLLF